MTKPLVNQYKNYLTVEARLKLDEIIALGIDPDLAMAMLDLEWDENDIYCIPEEMCDE